MRKVLFDNILATGFILVAFFAFSLIPFDNLDSFNPVSKMMGDFEFSDIAFSNSELRRDTEVDTNITLINLPPAHYGRAAIARQLQIINGCRPAVIGIDAFFRKLKTGTEEELMADMALAQAIDGAENIVLVSELTDFNESTNSFDSLKTSHPVFTAPALTGYANMELEQGAVDNLDFRVSRTVVPFEKAAGTHHNSFAAEICRVYRPAAFEELKKRDLKSEIINYRGNAIGDNRKFATIDWNDLENGNFDTSLIAGKAVLMGFMGTPTLDLSPTVYGEDKFFTPLNPNYVGKAYPDMYGIVVHANILSMYLHGNYINHTPRWFSISAGIFLIFINIIFFSFVSRKFPSWYDVTTKTAQLVELILLSYLVIQSINLFNVKIDLTLGIVGIALAADLLEIYESGVKNIAKLIKNKISTFRKK